MKKAIGLALTLGFALVSFTAAATEETATQHHRHHKHRAAPQAAEPQSPVVAPQAPEPAGGALKPYAHPGDGDNDGLSRDPDDCNKGCIGGNPG